MSKLDVFGEIYLSNLIILELELNDSGIVQDFNFSQSIFTEIKLRKINII